MSCTGGSCQAETGAACVLIVRLCLFPLADIQTALYELCWQVVLGNLKLDLAAGVLGDTMVGEHPALPLFLQLRSVRVHSGTLATATQSNFCFASRNFERTCRQS